MISFTLMRYNWTVFALLTAISQLANKMAFTFRWWKKTLLLEVLQSNILASYPLQPDKTGLGCLYFISNIESVALNEFKIHLHSLGKHFGFMALKKVTWLFRTLNKGMTQLFKCVKYFSKSRFLSLW